METKTGRDKILKAMKDRSFDLITFYLLEERPQNSVIQTTNLLSLLVNHVQARAIMFEASKEHYMKLYNINTLTDKNNKIISYF